MTVSFEDRKIGVPGTPGRQENGTQKIRSILLSFIMLSSIFLSVPFALKEVEIGNRQQWRLCQFPQLLPQPRAGLDAAMIIGQGELLVGTVNVVASGAGCW